MVAAFRFTDRIGKGLRTSPRDALIAESVSASDRGRAFGLHRSMDHAGAVVGPLIAAVLLSVAGFDIRQVILLAAIPAAMVVVVLVRFVKEPSTADATPPTTEYETAETGPDRLPREFKSLLVATVVFTLGNSTDAFFLLRFSELGLTPSMVAIVWAAHSGVKMLTTWLGGQATDRLGRKPLVMFGWLLYAATYVGFGVVTSLGPLVAMLLLYGATFGATEPAERAWVADLARVDNRGTAFGWYHGAIGAAALPASVGFGFVYERFGAAAAFVVGACLALAATGLLTRVRPMPLSTSESTPLRPR
jgi:MFS family permease